MVKLVTILLSQVLFFIAPSSAQAHTFGQLYNLPVPFWMYLYGGASALVVSFLAVGYFFNKKASYSSYPTINLSSGAVRFIIGAPFLKILKFLALALFILAVATGIFGVNISTLNFNMTFFWIIFVLGLTYITALVGNIWKVINPFKTIVELLESFLGQESFRGFLNYPQKLAYWPAFILYFIFIWIELLSSTSPFSLSVLLIQYTLLNLIGATIFGKQKWFKYAEFFSVFFRQVAKVAPLESRAGKLYLRPPFLGLINEKCEHFSLLIFILFMLSSTAFDGFRETLVWRRFIFGTLPGDFLTTQSLFQTTQTFFLFASPFVFLSTYLVLIGFMKFITKSALSLTSLALAFAFTLIPIALVYNVAHYYTLILTEGTNIIRLISDPFGYGWDLFQTANFYNFFTLGANITWHSQVGLIVLGHIVSVYLAHLVALQIFPSHKIALKSQIPMLLLMVTYTVIGLWILSQPITSG